LIRRSTASLDLKSKLIVAKVTSRLLRLRENSLTQIDFVTGTSRRETRCCTALIRGIHIGPEIVQGLRERRTHPLHRNERSTCRSSDAALEFPPTRFLRFVTC
jgi:hypothetical protein